MSTNYGGVALKPEKYGFFEFYLWGPLCRALLWAGQIMRVHILRHWYCGGCGVYHSPRVKRKRYHRELGSFTIVDSTVCSLWRSKYEK